MNKSVRNASAKVALLSVVSAIIYSSSVFACSSDPYIGSVCAMALSRNRSFGDGQYIPAAGQQLSITQNPALYAVIGATYGGDGVTNFKVPDLRGKVIVGYDERVPTQAIGSTGGASTITLTVAQLPPHAFSISNMPVTLNSLTATTTLNGLSGMADLSNITLTGPSSGLVINASSQSGLGSPNGNFIGKGNSTGGNNYSANTPDVTLNSKSISGDLSLIVKSGTKAPVAISGSASTTVSGVGAASGSSSGIGAGQPVAIMPPYLVMTYYIAVTGIYPQLD
ncbi:phage tail protein [Pseudomonas oryzihabitans]|nr:tail fiber protein [Pseudomonas oryzihabitans]